MDDSPVLEKCLELVGHELWSFVRPKDVWSCGPAKESASFFDKGSRGCVFPHLENVRPVSVAVDRDEELVSSVLSKVSSHMLEWSGWSRLGLDRFRWVGGQAVLAVPAVVNHVTYVLVDGRPI